MLLIGHSPAECEGRGRDPMFDQLFSRTREIVGGLDVDWLNLCRVAGSAEDFSLIDGHYSVLGNQSVGQAVAEKLAPLFAK